MRDMSAARTAYEANVKKWPLYHDKTPRKTWEQLDDLARSSWERIAREDPLSESRKL